MFANKTWLLLTRLSERLLRCSFAHFVASLVYRKEKCRFHMFFQFSIFSQIILSSSFYDIKQWLSKEEEQSLKLELSYEVLMTLFS